jgi:selenocysteine lyase/cysteine desulfurase
VHFVAHLSQFAIVCRFLVETGIPANDSHLSSPFPLLTVRSRCNLGSDEILAKNTYKVRPSTDEIPDRGETGTHVHELIAGVGAAVEYIAGVGRHSDPTAKTRREALAAAYRTTVAYERRLIAKLIEGLQMIPSVRIYGITDPKRFEERCSTLSLRIGDHSPKMIAEFLGGQGIFTWDGNYYALNLTERLQVEQKGGMLRIGLVHYNTLEEVGRLLSALREFASLNR